MGRNRQLWGKIFSFAGLIDDEWLYRAREFNAAAPKMVLFGKRVTGRRAIARGTRHCRVAQRRARVTGMLCPTEALRRPPHPHGKDCRLLGRKAPIVDYEKKLPLMPVSP